MLEGKERKAESLVRAVGLTVPCIPFPFFLCVCVDG